MLFRIIQSKRRSYRSHFPWTMHSNSFNICRCCLQRQVRTKFQNIKSIGHDWSFYYVFSWVNEITLLKIFRLIRDNQKFAYTIAKAIGDATDIAKYHDSAFNRSNFFLPHPNMTIKNWLCVEWRKSLWQWTVFLWFNSTELQIKLLNLLFAAYSSWTRLSPTSNCHPWFQSAIKSGVLKGGFSTLATFKSTFLT